MKKLVFMFAAVVAVSFASCGNKAQQAEVDTDSVEVVDSADTVAVDTVAADSTAAE
ncbi:MAG: hypothetical protein J6V87_00920 [Prevotella sp.]|nr:hypothetical protein [Prevotella sp.]